MNKKNYLRNTNGIPPRIALLPSNTACLLEQEKKITFFYLINKTSIHKQENFAESVACTRAVHKVQRRWLEYQH